MPRFHVLPPADDPFWIDDPLTVRQIVSELARRQIGIQCWLGRNEPVEANIVEVRDSDEIALRFVAGQALPVVSCPGEPVVVQAQLGSARISFLLEDLHRDEADASVHGVCALPLSVNRLQRREFFRVPSPVSLLCKLPGSTAEEIEAGHGRLVRLVDISVGGVCLVFPVDAELPVALGQTLQGCSLDLPEFGVIHFGLEFMNHPTGHGANPGQWIGARFVGMEPREQMLLQRFVYKLQADAHE